MSIHSQAGIMLSTYQPLAQGGAFLANYSEGLASWSHTSQADGGYWSARAGLSGGQIVLEDWIESGLGRHVELYGAELTPCFEGFVNVASINLGGFTYQIGPLLSIANYVRGVYSTVDTSVTPPAVGMRARTAIYQDAASIARFGRMEKILAMGGATAANAAQIAQMYLAERSLPDAAQSIQPGGAGAPAITLDILGYVHWLGTYHYNNTAAGTTTVRERIIAALAASPSLIYSADYGQMDANTTTIPTYENDDKTAWDVAKGAAALGDPADFARFTFGVYEKRQAYFQKMPDEIGLIYRLSSGNQAVETPGGARVQPWNVRPAQWLNVPDFLIGRANDMLDIHQDPRNIFIESVAYTAPYGLSVDGGKARTLPQKLAALGLSGIGG